MPGRPSLTEIDISVPYCGFNDTVSSSRYRWSCLERGTEPFVILQWTHAGEGVYEGRHGPQRVPKDHAFVAIIPEQSTYYYPPDARAPWVFTWMNWYGDFACELFRRFQQRFGAVVPLSGQGATAAALRRLAAMASQAQAPERSSVSLQTYAFLLEWWREAAAPSGGSENRLARAVQFCRQHFREPLGVKEIANEAGMSREHFTRLFVEEMGEPPAGFLRHLRVNEAAALLRETELPLREVAMRSGFYSARHLMRTFQRIHRIGPSAYRRKKLPAAAVRDAKTARNSRSRRDSVQIKK